MCTGRGSFWCVRAMMITIRRRKRGGHPAHQTCMAHQFILLFFSSSPHFKDIPLTSSPPSLHPPTHPTKQPTPPSPPSPKPVSTPPAPSSSSSGASAATTSCKAVGLKSSAHNLASVSYPPMPRVSPIGLGRTCCSFREWSLRRLLLLRRFPCCGMCG